MPSVKKIDETKMDAFVEKYPCIVDPHGKKSSQRFELSVKISQDI